MIIITVNQICQEDLSCSEEGTRAAKSEETGGGGGEDEDVEEEVACDVVLVVWKLVDLTAVG